jgi:hypothetical protein
MLWRSIVASNERKHNGNAAALLPPRGSEEPQTSSLTSATTVETVERGYDDYDDGLPIEFSWPVATETADPTDF